MEVQLINLICFVNPGPAASFTKPRKGTGHLKFKDFLEFLPPFKNLSFTKPPSLKETLKTSLNFKEAEDLP